MYNSLDFEGQLAKGQVKLRVDKDKHPTPPLAREKVCTRSQIASFLDQWGQAVCKVHRYVRLDGTLGASGKNDPKFLLHEGVRYVLDTEATIFR